MTTSILQRPQFKERVLVNVQETQVDLYLGSQGCSLAVELEDQANMIQLLHQLQLGGQSIPQLQATCPGLAEDIPALVAECDRRGLLTESATPLSGKQFYAQLSQFIAQRQQQYPASPFTEAMQSGSVTRNQLIGYVLESYHITHLCPAIVAPALANHETSTTKTLLQDFFSSELHHDKLVEKSLKSVGIQRAELEQMQPLPMTLSACALLSSFARQHPLSFKTALMLFEQDDVLFHQLFEQKCKAHNLPADFYRPILLHAGINEDGGHQDITGVLLAEIPYISGLEQAIAKQNMAILLDTFVARTHEILTYYGRPDSQIPRCF